MQKKYGHDKGVVLVALTDEDETKVKSFAKKNNINYIVGISAKDVRGQFGVNGFPTAFVIDPNGKIAWKGHPAMGMDEAIEKALKKTPPKASGGLGNATGTAALAKADELYKSKEYAKALAEYEKVAKANKDSDIGKKARAKVDAMKSDREIMVTVQDVETRKKCEGWMDMARTLAKSGKDSEAAKYYQRVIEGYPDSIYAETAKRELAKLDI